jgi:hypothetical protein
MQTIAAVLGLLVVFLFLWIALDIGRDKDR